VFAPSALLEGPFVQAPFQVGLLRFIGAAVIGWAVVDLLARHKGLRVPRSTRLMTITGFGLLAIGLLGPDMTMMFFSFPLLVGSMLSTSMVLADSWRSSVLASYQRPEQ